jgi:hypothetical protein
VFGQLQSLIIKPLEDHATSGDAKRMKTIKEDQKQNDEVRM